MTLHYLIPAALAALLLYAVLIYNGLVQLKNGVAKAWRDRKSVV